MEHTKGELIAEAFPGTENDPTWIIQDENNGIVFQTIGEYDEANAKELARRWNAFEKGEIVEELKVACGIGLKSMRDLLVIAIECKASNENKRKHNKLIRLVEAALAKS